jgi:NAD(P)-dependent dehydrogenase (short-subunit alcohol dehydrogenase family)
VVGYKEIYMTGRVVLVTGASSGIGRATAVRLAAAGFVVWASARSEPALAGLEGCRPLALEVTDEESRVAAIRRIEAESGRLDVLVNNAGYSQSGPVEEVPLEAWRKQFETNVFGPVRLAQLALPGMRARRQGWIVNVSSMGGTLTFPGGGAYHASKYALEAVTDALRFETRGFGVRVIGIQPGLIRTGFAHAAGARLATPEVTSPYATFTAAVGRATSEVYEKGPLARLGGEPDAVARVILRALTARSPRARYAVTPSASVLMAMRRAAPDWAWDSFLASNFPQPGVEPR